MPVKRAANPVGRPSGRSGLPTLKPGEPFSLIGFLRCCPRMLTVKDVAEVMDCPVSTIYAQIDKGKIPVANVGFDVTRIDPAQWARQLEKMNPHLVQSARAYQAA